MNLESMLCYNINYIQPNIIRNDNYGPAVGIDEGSSCAVASLDGQLSTDTEDLRSVAYTYLHRRTRGG